MPISEKSELTLREYEFLKTIGKGSYGEVWLCRQSKDSKQYVLKKIDITQSGHEERKAALLECKLLAELKHPNIVPYKESFVNAGFLYIAMGYCEGGDLSTRLKLQNGQLLSERRLVEWFIQIAIALQHMHSKNILHRDLKTQNIFLTRNDIIKVGDLGIARVLESANAMATTMIGTPYYMSPELFANKPYNHKSDIWALGCVLYEMSTLKHAFNAKSFNALSYKILSGKTPDMPTEYSPELSDILRAMLHQKPEKRPSARRVLSNAFIRKHIVLFLESTKDRHSVVDEFSPDVTEQPTSFSTGLPDLQLKPKFANDADAESFRRKPPLPERPEKKCSTIDVSEALFTSGDVVHRQSGPNLPVAPTGSESILDRNVILSSPLKNNEQDCPSVTHVWRSKPSHGISLDDVKQSTPVLCAKSQPTCTTPIEVSPICPAYEPARFSSGRALYSAKSEETHWSRMDARQRRRERRRLSENAGEQPEGLESSDIVRRIVLIQRNNSGTSNLKNSCDSQTRIGTIQRPVSNPECRCKSPAQSISSSRSRGSAHQYASHDHISTDQLDLLSVHPVTCISDPLPL
ncbi:serine/threonine-protein kinase Nek4, partial [Fasciola gigantica]